MHLLTRLYCYTCRVSNHSRGLYSMLPRLSLSSCKLFHVAGSCVHVFSRVATFIFARGEIAFST